ncbi:MAG: hypothetical protein HY711_04035, partial [Candidatus Melainabacteria bacterium]|nr:hypothetical protein [Candidatus Melainabacteria bacterium]
GLPQEIESIFDGQDIGTIWQQYVSSAPKAISSLHECELNINQLIFKCLADSAQLDSQDISILESWLEKEHAQQSQLSHLICTQEDFAHLVLYYTLIRSMDNGSASYSARLRTHGISPCFSLLLPLSDKQKIASVLGLKLQTIQWLESTFAMPLTSYLIGKFGKTHRRWFHGSPLLFCLSVADSEVLLITSSMAMRHLSSTCNTNLEMHWSKAIELWHKQAACHGAAHFNNSLDMQLTDLLARASKICSETVRKLSSTYNWTGADLEIALRQLQT